MAKSEKKHSSSSLRLKTTWQAMAWAMVAAVVWLTLTPSPPQPPVLLTWDKAQHFIAYGWLMYWFGMCFIRHWRWPAFLIMLGIGLEFVQGFGGIRTCDPYDMIYNSMGVLAGLVLVSTPLGQILQALDDRLSRQHR